jgi:hypothetical protein
MAQLKVLVVLAVVWLAAPSAFAHHPFGDEFDRSQSITLSGTLTRLDWQNPHVFAYIDVKDAQGKATNWKVEMGSPEALTREGWTRTSVKPGDQVTIQGWRSKNNVSLANAESFTLPDGKKIAAASSMHMEAQSQMAQAQDQPAFGQPSDDPTVGTTGEAGDALPATASPLALYGLIGLLGLGGAIGLRMVHMR